MFKMCTLYVLFFLDFNIIRERKNNNLKRAHLHGSVQNCEKHTHTFHAFMSSHAAGCRPKP